MFKRSVVLIVMTFLLALATASFAQRTPSVQPGRLDNATGARDIRQAQTPAPRISERQAVELARQKFTGNILRISLIGQGNALRYQIRMENEGKISTVFVNANTGAVSGP